MTGRHGHWANRTALCALALCVIATGVAAFAGAEAVRLRREVTADEAELAAARVGLVNRDQEIAYLQILALIPNKIFPDQDPAYSPIQRQRWMREFEREYGHAFNVLGLEQDKAARFKELLIARTYAMMDAKEAARKNRLTSRDMKASVDQAVAGINHEMVQLVGLDNFKILEQYARDVDKERSILQERHEIEMEVGFDCKQAGVPLSDDAIQAIAQALYDASHGPHPVYDFAVKPDARTGLNSYYAYVFARASSFINDAQQAILSKFYQEQSQNSYYIHNWIAKQRSQVHWTEGQDDAVQAERESIRRGLNAAEDQKPPELMPAR